jgi:RHS repeat-associated protein
VLEEHISLNSQPVTLNRAYTYGSDLISEDQWTGTAWVVSFYGYDGHGNVRYLTDTNSAVTDTYDYDAFGTLIAHSGTTPNNYFYCGEQFDADLGLYYNRARYLDVDSGRFWTTDESEGKRLDPLSLHKFLFANDCPVNLRDRSGHDVDNTDFFLDGILVTRDIGGHFVNQKPNRLANYFPIGGIINRSEGYDDLSDDYLLSIGELGLKPDLVDLDTREVWEIKTTRGFVQGEAELIEYLIILNAAKKPGSKPWTPGISYTPPPFARGLFRTVDVYEQGAGIITYDPMITNEELVYAVGFSALFRLASIAQSEQEADVEATTKTAFALEAY